MTRKKIYICSQMRGDFEGNRKRAKYYSRVIYNRGYFPVCPHLYLEEATGLSEEYGDRKELLEMGIEMLKMCDEIWVLGDKISEGMKNEIDFARKNNIKVLRMESL